MEEPTSTPPIRRRMEVGWQWGPWNPNFTTSCWLAWTSQIYHSSHQTLQSMKSTKRSLPRNSKPRLARNGVRWGKNDFYYFFMSWFTHSFNNWILCFQVFETLDACVTPVLSAEEAAVHPHNAANNVFGPSPEVVVPNPAPCLSRSPGQSRAHLPRPHPGQHTLQVLMEAGLTRQEVADLQAVGAVSCADSKLWYWNRCYNIWC